MSIMRFSAIREQLTVPNQEGGFIAPDYHPVHRVGSIGFFPNCDGKESLPPDFLANSVLDGHVREELLRVGAKLGEDQPILVMVNGFLFNPTDAVDKEKKDTDNPHKRLFDFDDRYSEETDIKEHTTCLPLRLGFEEHDQGAKGLAVSFGWDSYPGFFRSFLQGGKNFYRAAYENGRDSSWVLVALLDALARHLPNNKIDILCHSLGSSIAIRALAGMAKHTLPALKQMGRIIILGGSEYTGEANLMYRRVEKVSESRGWDAAQEEGPIVYNIVSRENAILDVLGENFGPRGLFTDSQVVGHNGLQARAGADRWIDMQIDGAKFSDWASKNHGIRVSGDNPGTVWDHWYYYTYRPNLDLYRNILRNRETWSLPNLRNPRTGEPIVEGVDRRFFGN